MKRVFFFIYEWPQRVPETGGIVGRTGGRGSHTVIDCHDLWPTLGMGTQLPWGLVAIQEPLSHSLLLVYSSACSFQTQEFSKNSRPGFRAWLYTGRYRVPQRSSLTLRATLKSELKEPDGGLLELNTNQSDSSGDCRVPTLTKTHH